ncbi:MAG: MATE family efflux transporter [Myxococcota bacterium]
MTLPANPSAQGAIPTGLRPRGNVREVFGLAAPVVLTHVSITITQIVDSAMAGRLGPTELAAVGFGGIWMWTAMCFFAGTVTAVQTFVSQHHGAGEPERCGAWAWQGVLGVTPLTLAGAAVLYLGAGPLMRALGPSGELAPLATGYIEMRAFGNVGLCGAMALSSFFRGVGDTRTPLWTMVLANGVNAVLDYGLIFGRLGLPQWGVEGAGVATAVAEWVYFGATYVCFRRRRVDCEFRTGRPSLVGKDLRRLLRTGMPIGGQWCLEMISFAVFSTLVARMGDASMAASQAFIMLLALTFMQAHGLSIAVATLVGRYIGARDPRSAERSFRSGVALGLALAAAIALLYVVFPEWLIAVFSDDPEVLRLARPLLLVGAFFQVFDAVAIVADGALRGAGDTRWPFVLRFVLSWGLFVPLAWLIGFVWGFGLTGAWFGGMIYVAVLAAFLVGRFHSGAWHHVRI